MSAPSREDRIEGCFVGGAIGDAIGAHFETNPCIGPLTIPKRLRITDDTQLTLATNQSILESQSVVPESIANEFATWFRERRLRGLGASTYKALNELVAGGHWALVGAVGEFSAGNGAAMRIAPLAFFLDPDYPEDRQLLRDTCRITHRNDEAYIGALAIIRAIRHVASGNPCDRGLLTALIDSIPDSRVRDRIVEIRISSASADDYTSQFPTSGYVVDSVPYAILMAIDSRGFLDSVETIVQSGGDTDTIASMFGNIYGAAHGIDSLPEEIADRVEEVELIRKMARRIAIHATST